VPVSKTPISTDDRCSGKPGQISGDPDSLRCLDDTHAGIPQLDKYLVWDDFGQSLVLDPLLQDRLGNVSSDRDLFTPGHEGMGTQGSKAYCHEL
jgi:hypothetical protein